MPRPFHLIDGYNLLHAAGLARETYGPGDYERVRFALLLKIAEGLDDDSRERTTVIFDAFDPPPDAASGFRFHEMRVQFAVESGEADQLIEQLIRRHASPRQLRVVSDDGRLQRAAKRRGAAAVKCDAFLRRLDRHVNTAGRPVHRAAPNMMEEADWSEYFGLTGQELSGELTKLPSRESSLERPVDSPPVPPKNVPQPAPSGQSSARREQRPSRGKQPRDALPLKDEERREPIDDLAFWQGRIDEALAEERTSRPRRPESS